MTSPHPEVRSTVLLVVDGNSVAHRAWHAYRRAGLTADGLDVTVRYGFTALLVAMVDKVTERFRQSPAGVVVAFDGPDNWRRTSYEGYKAQRPPTDPELRRQLAELPELLSAFGIMSVSLPGFEADDVCASAAAATAGRGWRCVVATSDRDAVSVVDESVTMLRLGNGMDKATWLAPDDVEATFGVRPDRYLLLAALRGDTSDNLPGVRGVGPSKAAALAATFATFDEMLAAPALVETVAGKRAVVALKEAEPEVRRNLHLMSLRRDLPVDVDGSTLRHGPEELFRTAQHWNLPGLAHRVSVAFSAPAVPHPNLFDDEPVLPVRTLFDDF